MRGALAEAVAEEEGVDVEGKEQGDGDGGGARDEAAEVAEGDGGVGEAEADGGAEEVPVGEDGLGRDVRGCWGRGGEGAYGFGGEGGLGGGVIRGRALPCEQHAPTFALLAFEAAQAERDEDRNEEGDQPNDVVAVLHRVGERDALNTAEAGG